jgi:hypothetical protein
VKKLLVAIDQGTTSTRAIGFIMSSFGNFWAMFGSFFFLVGCLVFLIPYLRKED